MKTQQFLWSAVGGWSPHPPAHPMAAGPEASAQLVLMFGGVAAVEASHIFDLAAASYPDAHLLGCTTAGEIHGTCVSDDTLAVTVVEFDHTRLRTAHVAVPSPAGSFAAGEALARSLVADGLRHVFVLSEGLQVNGSELVRGLNAVLPRDVTVSGGFAGDGNRLRETHVWCDGEPAQAAAVAFGLYGDRLKVGLAASGGWEPIGPDRLITRSRHNVLYELDGRSALALYKEYLGEHAQGLPASGLLFPLGLRVDDRGGRALRALLAVDEQEQSITFAGDVPEGSYVRLMVGRIESLIDGAQAAAQSSMEGLGGHAPQLSILVSCNGRRPVLKQMTEEEVEVSGDVLGPHAAVTGFYSYGEIAPVTAGGQAELLNQTMAVTSFAEV